MPEDSPSPPPSPTTPSPASSADPDRPPSGPLDATAAPPSDTTGEDILATCLELIAANDGGGAHVSRAQEIQPISQGQALVAVPPQPPGPQLLQQCVQIAYPPAPQPLSFPPAVTYANPPLVPMVVAPPQRFVVVQQPQIRPVVVPCVPFSPRPVFLSNIPQPSVCVPQATANTTDTASSRPSVKRAKKTRKRRGNETVIINEGEECVDDPREVRLLGSPEKQRPPHCEICGREFSAERFLRLHVAEIHEEGGKGRFTCGDCGKVYTRLRSLERHQNRHHLDGDPVCKICRKRVVNFDLHYRRFHCKSKSTQACPKSKRRRKKKVHVEAEVTD